MGWGGGRVKCFKNEGRTPDCQCNQRIVRQDDSIGKLSHLDLIFDSRSVDFLHATKLLAAGIVHVSHDMAPGLSPFFSQVQEDSNPVHREFCTLDRVHSVSFW